jgi:hypothetical protein
MGFHRKLFEIISIYASKEIKAGRKIDCSSIFVSLVKLQRGRITPKPK